MWLNVGKCIFFLLVIWLLFILFLTGPFIKGSEQDDQIVARLTRAIKELEVLKQQNEELHHVLHSLKITSSDKIESSDLQAKLSNHILNDKAPSNQREELRRRLENGVKEWYFLIDSQITKLNTSQNYKTISDIRLQVNGHKSVMLNDLFFLKNEDSEWRKKESQELSDLVQKRIHYLQHPKDCSNAKKLVCNLNKGCGYGCQIHHVVYCFIVAYATERTLILRSSSWRYSSQGWESVFLPLSNSCVSEDGSSRGSWPSLSSQVVDLPIVDNIHPRPSYLPLAIPKDLAPRMSRLHGNPPVWWIGQFLKYMLKPQPHLKKFLDDVEKKMNYKSPIVGIHVRRTDKIGTEAAFHSIEEYMDHVEEYFKQKELETSGPVQRVVFLATDDSRLLSQARTKYPQYQFLGDQNVAQSAALGKRYSLESLKGIILDIHMLSKCDYLVCTFSSQVCRLAFEIMQTFHPDASANFYSLDDIFYFGGQNDHNQIALYDHKAQSSDEFDFQRGDILGIAGNHWNGFSKGINRRTKKSGLYPSYKAKDKLDIEDFPIYNEANS